MGLVDVRTRVNPGRGHSLTQHTEWVLSVSPCLLLRCSGRRTDKPTAAADYTTPVARDLRAKHVHKAKTSILGGLWEVPHGELDMEGKARFTGQSREEGLEERVPLSNTGV